MRINIDTYTKYMHQLLNKFIKRAKTTFISLHREYHIYIGTCRSLKAQTRSILFL
jgi:hypothetical protein